MLAQLSTGEFLLGGVVGGDDIFVYDAGGQFVRAMSRQGQGPGELQGMARIWVGPGDTLFVADDGNTRLQVLTSGGEYVRSFQMPALFRRFARLGTGDFVFARSVTSPGDDTFVLVDAVGREVESFSPSLVAEPDLERGLASPRPGTEASFWTASIWHYAVHEWSARGESDRSLALERTLVREADWFPAYPEFGAEVYETAPPPAGLHHIWEDDEGFLWVYALLPDADWRPGIPFNPRPAWQRDTFDHRVEVVDLSSGRVVAVGEHEDRLSPVCGSKLMYAVTETPAGDLRVKVVEPYLTRAPSGS